ncbi:MAG: Asp-tRNA(Asn)/Glu-tRNA(Gln) amidotransferase subunit GatC [Brevinema sp.]
MAPFETDSIAALAYLQLRPEEKENLYTSMNNILGFVDTIASLELEGLEPTVRSIDIPPVSRPDVINPGLTQDDLAENIVKLDEGFIIVPQVIKK